MESPREKEGRARVPGKPWSRRARWTLPLALFWAAVVVGAARSDHALPALVPLASMAWAGMYGGASGGLWLWRLLSHNAKGRPL